MMAKLLTIIDENWGKNMCGLCKKIYSRPEAVNWKRKWWEWDMEQPYTIIVNDEDCFSLWNQVDDNFYTGRVMDIEYCPVCGRQLKI